MSESKLFRTVYYKGAPYAVPKDLTNPEDVRGYLLSESVSRAGPIRVNGTGEPPVSQQVGPAGPTDPARGPLGQFAYGTMEGLSNVAGMILPGISGEEVQQKLRSPGVFPEHIAPPSGFLGKAARFTGQQLGGVAAAGPLTVGAGAIRGGAGIARGLGKEGLYRGIASEGAYSIGGGVGQAIGSNYGPSGELTGSLAGLGVPPLLRAGLIRGMRGEFVGGDASFGEFQKNRRAFENADINIPSLGAASQKVRPIEAAFESVPGTFGVFHKRARDVYSAANDRMLEIRRAVSFEDSAGEAGQAIKEGLLGSPTRKGWIDRFRSEASARYAKLDAVIGKNTLVDFDPATYSAPRNVGPQIDPNTSAVLEQKRFTDKDLRDVMDALSKDAASHGGKVSYGTLQDARSYIGTKLADTDILGIAGFPRAEYKRIYGLLSEDMKRAAVSNGALKEFERANSYWANNIEAVDQLASVLSSKGASPERLFTWAMADAGLGASRISQLRSRLTRGQFDVVRSATMRRMGFPVENAADDFGPDFQPLRFLKNYEKMDPAARDAMFGGINIYLSGASANLKGSLDAIAEVGRLMRESGGVMANPSGTAGRGLNAATLWAVSAMSGGALIGAFSGEQPAEGAAYGGLGGLASLGAGALITRQIAKRLWTNPRFITWLGEAQKLPPERIPGHLGRLLEVASDPESTAAVQAYIDTLMQVNAASAEQMRKNNAVVR